MKEQVLVLLVVCFTVLLGHNLVPHDHHAGTMGIIPLTSCPDHANDHHETSGKSGHCHAFNGLDFFRSGSTVTPAEPWSLLLTADLPPVTDENGTAGNKQLLPVRTRVVWVQAIFLRSILLRGPPVLA